MNQTDELDDKLKRLRTHLRTIGKGAVAFSGGVDSSLLLQIAKEELGDDVIALIAVSPVLPRRDLQEAVELARRIGVTLIQVASRDMEIDDFVSNGRDRCYHCKMHNLQLLAETAENMGYDVLMDGTNADDMRSTRPGLRSLQETGTLSPLAAAGITKDEVRRLAQNEGLPNWDRPSSPCLSSRLPYGERITPEKLGMIELAENALHDLGIRQFRVRMHGDVARIEVDELELAAVLQKKDAVVRAVKKAGFRFVSMDLEGFRSGSMDR